MCDELDAARRCCPASGSTVAGRCAAASARRCTGCARSRPARRAHADREAVPRRRRGLGPRVGGAVGAAGRACRRRAAGGRGRRAAGRDHRRLGPGRSVADALLGRRARGGRRRRCGAGPRRSRPCTSRPGSRATGSAPRWTRARATCRSRDVAMSASIVDDAVRVLERECARARRRVPARRARRAARPAAQRLGRAGVRRAHPGRRLPGQQRRHGDRLRARRLRGRAVAPRRVGRRLPAVPWPTCWCSWRMPRRGRRARRRALPRAADRRCRTSPRRVPARRRRGRVGWALLSTTWFLRNALGDDPPADPARPTPTPARDDPAPPRPRRALDRAARAGRAGAGCAAELRAPLGRRAARATRPAFAGAQ